MLKSVHLFLVTLSVTAFCFRFGFQVLKSIRYGNRWINYLPHLVDTGIVVTGISLIFQARQYPLIHGWLTVKLGLLILYILAGMQALHWAKSNRERVWAGASALIIIAAMVFVAVTH